MGGGTLWRSVVRAVGAAAPTVAVSNAAYCSACTATPTASTASPRSRVGSCTCRAAGVVGAVQGHPGLSSTCYGPRQLWDLDDWEFAGDEEKDHFVFGLAPTAKEVEEASSDLQNALRWGFFAPPVPRSDSSPKVESSSLSGPNNVEVTALTEVSTVTTVGDVEEEINSDLSAEPQWIEPPPYQVAASPRHTEGPSSAMMEAFHQFQHNPQVQGMVVSLATDKGVWEAVLANEKIQEFRRNLSTPSTEVEGDVDQKVKSTRKNANVFSRLFWKSKRPSPTSFKVFKTS